MKEDLFNYFTTDNTSGKKCTEKWLSKNNIELYNKVKDWCCKNNLQNLEFKRKIFHFVTNNNKIPVCLSCGKDVKYKRLRDGYQSYCSSKCQNSCSYAKEKWLKSWKIGNSNNEHIVSRYKTILEKYGNSKDYNKYINESRKETCLEKYGVEYITQLDSYKEKRKNTLKEKYGSETFNNPIKTKNTRINNGTQIDDSIINDFLMFKKVAVNKTYTMYRNNKTLINPNNLKRGIKSYHIDHKFSLKQAYLMGLPIEVVTHPANLEMIYYKDNLVKQDNCSISIEELLNNIINFKDELYFTNNELKDKYMLVKESSKLFLNSYKV
jgi:hypothetical protein